MLMAAVFSRASATGRSRTEVLTEMPLPITTLAASALALLLFVVSLRVIFFRRKNRISIGDGGEEELAYRVRAQANLTEYAPITLILIGLAELQDAPFWLALARSEYPSLSTSIIPS